MLLKLLILGQNPGPPKTPMPTARYGLAVGVINGILYAVGGQNNSAYLSTVEAYDPTTDSWTTTAPMPTARTALGVGVINGILYAVGGESAGKLNTVEAYDPATDSWSTKMHMPGRGARNFGVGVLEHILYTAGGEKFTEHVEAYDPPRRIRGRPRNR